MKGTSLCWKFIWWKRESGALLWAAPGFLLQLLGQGMQKPRSCRLPTAFPSVHCGQVDLLLALTPCGDLGEGPVTL